MLEVRGISKTYRAKTGVSVKALDNVNLTFPETGMVFLLGKSGSGKSTLLNVIGGLDKFDTGELIIKGRSSADFRGSDFDAYRNTFIGFIFQEYNILDEFTVGANIALALELQGKKASSEEVNAILEQVDLQGYASRKPNELSGGQKQRIAIARALIKDPEIIMADEPTGALDSTTGRQVLDTLKALSKKKLVLVVSHDREFAEKYADRIVELSDGRVISDMSLSTASAEEAKGVTQVSDDIIHIRRGYLLTEEDMRLINAYLAKNDRDIILSKDEQINAAVCQSLGITGETVVTAERVPTGVVTTRQYNGRETRFIKSRLPLKNAARMGANSMKTKPVRLIFTIFLSFIAFALFGLADTMASYDKYVTTTDSLYDSGMATVALNLRLRQENVNIYDGEEHRYVDYWNTDSMSDEDILALKEQTGLTFYPVYTGSNWNNSVRLPLVDTDTLENDHGYSMFDGVAYGITALTAEDITSLGFTYEGAIPAATAKNEIMITDYLFKMMQLSGVQLADDEGSYLYSDEITDFSDLQGKEIYVQMDGHAGEYKIVGLLNTGFDFDDPRFAPLHWDYTGERLKERERNQLEEKMTSTVSYSFSGLLVGSRGMLDALPKPQGNNYKEYGIAWHQGDICLRTPDEDEFYFENYFNRFVGNDGLSDFDIVFFEEGKDKLRTGEVVVPFHTVQSLFETQGVKSYELVDGEILGIPGLYDAMCTLRADYENLQTLQQLFNDWEHFVDEEYYPGTYVLPEAEFKGAVTSYLNNLLGVTLTWEDYYQLKDRLEVFYANPERISAYTFAEHCVFLDWIATPANFELLIAEPAFVEVVKGNYGESYDLTTAPRWQMIAFAYEYMYNKRWEEGYRLPDGSDVNALIEAGKEQLYASMTLEHDELNVVKREWSNGGTMEGNGGTVTIVGYYVPRDDTQRNTSILLSEQWYQFAKKENEKMDNQNYTIWGQHTSGKWSFVLAQMPQDKSKLEPLSTMHYKEEGEYVFRLLGDVASVMDQWGDMIEEMSKIFLYIGIGFAAFAALMMLNFISASVTQKKKEIGILRAVGARSSDVFSIFFFEAFLVAIINFILAIIAVVAVIIVINNTLRNELGFPLTLLHFGFRQV
ncbi:MAG: ABC transporter ATP-binding protein/permease, partial [Clostridia bacterium]|nr:ABC transporter ATP-binding protein/permease [Clostridia bacterium]